MEGKTTTGPWEVEDRRRAALKNIRVVGPNKEEVCQVSHVHQRDLQAGYHSIRDNAAADALDCRGLADAHLIAAAPDLLAALEATEAKGCNCMSNMETEWHSPKCHIPKVRSAISKARGERP